MHDNNESSDQASSPDRPVDRPNRSDDQQANPDLQVGGGQLISVSQLFMSERSGPAERGRELVNNCAASHDGGTGARLILRLSQDDGCWRLGNQVRVTLSANNELPESVTYTGAPHTAVASQERELKSILESGL